jgi:hypothetical protein
MGTPCLSGTKVALCKLQRRGLLAWKQAAPKSAPKAPNRLRGHPLAALANVSATAGQVRGLRLRLISDRHDPLPGIWNDLIIAQHPCGDAPLAGAQLRYLVGSEHGWRGAPGFATDPPRCCWKWGFPAPGGGGPPPGAFGSSFEGIELARFRNQNGVVC